MALPSKRLQPRGHMHSCERYTVGEAGPAALGASARDWIESQSRVMGFWLDQLIAEGDPQDLVSTIHRQAAWLDMMQAKLAR